MLRDETVDVLATYLQDHSAGSVAGVQLAERIVEDNQDNPIGTAFSPLVGKIKQDQQVLEEIISRLDASQPSVKNGFAWIAEKLLGLKFASFDEPQSDLARLEQLEAMMLGVRGKQALWEMLAEIAPQDERLAGYDFPGLAKSAQQQVATIESLRLQVGRRMMGLRSP